MKCREDAFLRMEGDGLHSEEERRVGPVMSILRLFGRRVLITLNGLRQHNDLQLNNFDTEGFVKAMLLKSCLLKRCFLNNLKQAVDAIS